MNHPHNGDFTMSGKRYDLSRLFTLSAKHRGGWEALETTRQRHHAVHDRFREHQLRAFWSLVAPQDNPHPLLERHG